MTESPLLRLASGRSAKPRKAPINRPKEITLHMSVAKLLRAYARSDWQWTHVASGELRDARTAGKLKQMGTRAGWPDFILIPPTGQMHYLELKRLGGRLSDEQDAFRLWCIRHAIPHVVAFKIEDVLAAFDAWGCLRIKISEAAQ